MRVPWKQNSDIDTAVSATKSAGVKVSRVEVEAIQFPAAMTGATVSFEGVPLALGAEVREVTAPADGDYVGLVDDAGAAITVTVTVSKIVVLTGTRLQAVKGLSWLRLVSASSEAANRSIVLMGHVNN